MRLRAIEPEDLDLLYQIENDQSLWQVGTTNVPYSRYTLHDYIANSSDDIYADRQVRMMVENDEGETVGIVDLVQFSPQHQRAEVGIVILNAHRRNRLCATMPCVWFICTSSMRWWISATRQLLRCSKKQVSYREIRCKSGFLTVENTMMPS